MSTSRFVVQCSYDGEVWFTPSHLWDFGTVEEAMPHYDRWRSGPDASWRIVQIIETVIIQEASDA